MHSFITSHRVSHRTLFMIFRVLTVTECVRSNSNFLFILSRSLLWGRFLSPVTPLELRIAYFLFSAFLLETYLLLHFALSKAFNTPFLAGFRSFGDSLEADLLLYEAI